MHAFVALHLKRNAGSVMTFVNILVKVFDRCNRRGNLNINMAVIFLGKVRVVWNDVAIVEQESVLFDFRTIVRSAIDRISALSDGSVFAEWLWIFPIAGFTVGRPHTACVPVKRTARAMKHEVDNCLS